MFPILLTAMAFSRSVRPPESLTEPSQTQTARRVRDPASQSSDYGLDHLIDLASDIRSLWPEPNTFQQFKSSAFVHNDKDAREAYTFHATCTGKVNVTATRPDARGRRLPAALLAQRVTDAVQSGACIVFGQADDLGASFRNMLRAGLSLVYDQPCGQPETSCDR